MDMWQHSISAASSFDDLLPRSSRLIHCKHEAMALLDRSQASRRVLDFKSRRQEDCVPAGLPAGLPVHDLRDNAEGLVLTRQKKVTTSLCVGICHTRSYPAPHTSPTAPCVPSASSYDAGGCGCAVHLQGGETTIRGSTEERRRQGGVYRYMDTRAAGIHHRPPAVSIIKYGAWCSLVPTGASAV